MSKASYACRRPPFGACKAAIAIPLVIVAPALGASAAAAQTLGYAPASSSPFATEDGTGFATPPTDDEGDGSTSVVPERLRRTIVNYSSHEPPGTVIIDTANTALYYVLG